MSTRDLVTAILVLAALAGLARLLTRADEAVGPARAVDGDTLEIVGQRVRLSGIDAPEFGQTCGTDVAIWPCGAEARTHLASLVRGKIVTCRGNRHDGYGRLVAICSVGQGEGAIDLAADMVTSGLAVAASGRGYKTLQSEAQARGRGIWSGPFQRPADWRAAHAAGP